MTTNRRLVLCSAAALAGALTFARRGHAAPAGPPLSAGERAAHALNRLGYGPRPADGAAIAAEGAQAWLARFLADQLEPRRLAQPEALTARLSGMEALRLGPAALLGRYRSATRAAREARREQARGAAPDAAALNAVREQVRPLVVEAEVARLARALQSPAQLEEVLVEFWFNHFNVFAGKGPVGVLVADYEQSAIRPFVFGRFRDMLGATARHPAMLVYLDNAQSKAGALNENYARELMELHTLGVDGGYTQRDVTELARMLTGWGLAPRAGDGFRFEPRRHDHGAKNWLGHAVRGAGQAEGELALDVLAAHPATAHHLASRFAQAFVADEPPPTLVAKLADSFRASGGDLREFTRTLVTADEFWSREAWQAKFKTPYQYLVSSLRALDLPLTDPQPLLAALRQAGQPLYGAVTPDGYKNTAAAWRNPEALTQRVQLATQLARRSGLSADTLGATLGAVLGDTTRRTLVAEPAGQQVALLLASPDFMKR